MKNKYIKGAHFSERKFRELLQLFCEDISTLTASKLLGLSVKTVQRIYTLLRERILSLASEENRPFAGEVEVDESYFGAKRIRGKRGRGASGKTPVIGLLKRDGRVIVAARNCCLLLRDKY